METELDVVAKAHAPEPDVGIFGWQIEDISWTPDIKLTDKEQEMIEEKLQEAASSYD